jgi:general secretion pathway protein D
VTTPPTKFKPLLVLGLAALVGLGGCATTREVAPAPWAPAPEAYEPGTMDEALDAGAETEAAPLRSVKPGSGQFINEDVTRRVPPGAGASGDLTFNFEGESLHAVIKALLGDFLQQNYVVAPGVQGTVTFSTAKPLRGDQALSVLEMLLRWNNATMVWQDGRYTILPVAQALPGNLTPRTGPLQNIRGYEVRAIPLQYISALEMEKLLKPYAKPEAVINVDPARNMLVLAGTRAELENYLQTIATFDVDWLSGMSVGVFPLQQAEASKTVGELEKIIGEGRNTPHAGMFRFMPLEGINAVMVITPQSKYLAQVEEWLERLDLGGGQAGQRLYVYDVKNVKATDLAATLGEIFGGSVGASVTRANQSPSGDRLMPGLEPVEIRTVGGSGNVSPSAGTDGKANDANASTNRSGNSYGGDGAPAGRPDAGPAVDAAGGISLSASEEVRISASEESNALLVMATSGQWDSIRRVIERLDTIPLQVHIEAKIIRVALNKELNYGVQWFFENGVPEATRGLTTGRNIWGDYAGSVNAQGISWTFLGPSAQAVITALDSVSDTTVLSMPSLVVLNNKTANIDVGQQIPVASSFYGGGINNPNDPNNPNLNNNSYVQFRQTGITLSVTPRVNPGGLVFLEIEQQESAPSASGVTIGGNPSVDNRSISTEVAVQSGETLVLGGLIKTIEERGQGGLPGLSRIPLIGGLFGQRNQSANREELLVLITPHVIRNELEARRLTEDYSRQFRGMEPLRVRVEKEASRQ